MAMSHTRPTPARHPRRRPHALAAAVVGLLGAAASPGALAATCTWNTANGNWAAIVNWTSCAAGNGNPVGSPGAA